MQTFLFLWHPLVVTWTGKEAQSKNKDKAKEETILPKCNVTVYPPTSNNSWTRGEEEYNETKKESINSSNSSQRSNNSLKYEKEDSGN